MIVVSNSGVDTEWQVFGPDGKDACKGWHDASAGTCTDLPASGTYSIVIRAYSDTRTGDYGIAFAGVSSDATCGVAVAFGQTLTSSLRGPGDFRSFAFQGKAGGTVQVTAVGAAVDTIWTVLGPDGADACDGWHDSSTATCPGLKADGTYTVAVADYGYDKAGEFNITLQKIGSW